MHPTAENLLKAVHFGTPDYIPVRVGISSQCWQRYPQDALQEIMAAHPLLFPGFQPSTETVIPRDPPWRRQAQRHTDSWGCVWRTLEDGITGSVVQHRLLEWCDLDKLTPPDPDQENGWTHINWEQIRKGFEQAHQQGHLRRGSLRHGHSFLTLTYLRGYENLLFDMIDEEPRLWKLIEMVEEFNLGLVERFVSLGADWLGYPEDLGMQVGPMLSPTHFQRYIKPVYQRLMKPAQEVGCVLHMHSDGDIRELAWDILNCGVQVLNLQDLVNGIDWIRDNLKGRVCIDLDVDRQRITQFGTPEQIDALIREEVTTLGSKEGGLMMTHEVQPGPPLENVRAVMDALEKYAIHYA